MAALKIVVPRVLAENFWWSGVESRRTRRKKCSGGKRIAVDHGILLQTRVASSSRLSEALVPVLTGRCKLLLAKGNRSVPRLRGCQHPCGSFLWACRSVMLHSRWNGAVPIGQCVNAVGQQEALVVESAQPTLLRRKKINRQGKNFKVIRKTIADMFFEV